MHLGIDFFWILMDFGKENGAKLAPKSHPTCGFLKIREMPFGVSPLAPNEVRGVQVGSQNRSKIDRNLKSKIERLLASIFRGFWRVWGGKLEGKSSQDRPKIDAKKASKKWWENKRKKSNPVSWGLGRAMELGGSWDPLHGNFQGKQHHNPQDNRTIQHVMRAKALADIYI